MRASRQTIYKALNNAMTGPDNGDHRRSGSSRERLEYLTDAVVEALGNEEESAPDFSFLVKGDYIPSELESRLIDCIVSLKGRIFEHIISKRSSILKMDIEIDSSEFEERYRDYPHAWIQIVGLKINVK